MAKLFILRHGNTFDAGDTITRVGGRTDMPLSQSGLKQAGALGDYFANTPFAAAFCSSLVRTRATARAILNTRTDAPPLLIAPFLKEVDYGPDENKPEADVIARLGEEALSAWDRDAAPPDGWHVDVESIRTGWQNLFTRAQNLPDNANALIVTSNGVARFVPELTQDAPAGLDRKLKTAAWGIVEIDGDNCRITAWGKRL